MASKHSISRRSFLKAVGAGSAAVAAAGVLTACGGSSSSTASSAASAAPATTELAAEQVLNLIYTDLSLIDVNDVRNSNEFEVLTAVQEGLFRTFTDENGDLPEQIEPAGLNEWVFNEDTIRKALDLLMTNGLKIDYGEKLGKLVNQKKMRQIAQKIFDDYYKQFIR